MANFRITTNDAFSAETIQVNNINISLEHLSPRVRFTAVYILQLRIVFILYLTLSVMKLRGTISTAIMVM
jgi:hypothetical protein